MWAIGPRSVLASTRNWLLLAGQSRDSQSLILIYFDRSMGCAQGIAPMSQVESLVNNPWLTQLTCGNIQDPLFSLVSRFCNFDGICLRLDPSLRSDVIGILIIYLVLIHWFCFIWFYCIYYSIDFIALKMSVSCLEVP